MAKSKNPELTSQKISFIHAFDLTGQRFGRALVLRRDEKISGKGARWICKCDCGNEFVTLAYYLRKGDTKSCGCLKSKYKYQKLSGLFEHKNTIHGLSYHPLYVIHGAMLGRCFNLTDQNYLNYGGRGITVCPEWKADVKVFYNWAITNGYKQGLFLDRENNDGNYEPSNCRWITQKESNQNMRRHGGWTKKSQKKKENEA